MVTSDPIQGLGHAQFSVTRMLEWLLDEWNEGKRFGQCMVS